jgi:membrane fusion protein (multidrug efflux system)
MLRQTFIVLVFAVSVVACNKDGDMAGKKASATTRAPLLIAAEDLFTVHSSALASGPAITGTVQPARRADLRAEISSMVLQVLKENGESVKRGEVLVRLEDAAIRDSLSSAEQAARSAGQSLAQAERQFARMQTLRGAGMTSTQSVDDAETRRNNAQSDVAAAKTRAVQARQQLQRTLVRAPFDGVVSDRKTSPGDTASIGKELIKVVDPASMRFEGLVSADKISQVKLGQKVSFRVNGYGGQQFVGMVKRIDPSANEITRQVEVLVAFADGVLPRVSGLYAEGTIEIESMETLTIPETALVRDAEKTFVWRVADNQLNQINIAVGARNARRGDYPVLSGLNDGDRIVRSPVVTFKNGEKVKTMVVPKAAALGVATSALASASASASQKQGK